MFLVQATLLGLLAATIFLADIRRRPVLAAMIAVWVAGVIAIRWRYGYDGQLTFYSNDQEFHLDMLGKLEWGGRPLSIQDVIDRRYAYTGPAWIMTRMGFDAVLSLKFVSLIGMLLTWRTVVGFLERSGERVGRIALWAACGPIVVFFSLLALRETLLIALATYLLLGANPSMRAASFLLIGVLRPHLALALIGAAALWLVIVRIPRHLHALRLGTAVLVPLAASTTLFSLGISLYYDSEYRFLGSVFSKLIAYRALGNFFGLQFLGADLVAIERSLIDLVLPRLVFPETLLVPLVFSLLLFVPSVRHDTRRLFVTSAFAFYIGITTMTEYNSFRQNLPFIPTMAVLAILVAREAGGIRPFRRVAPRGDVAPSTLR